MTVYVSWRCPHKIDNRKSLARDPPKNYLSSTVMKNLLRTLTGGDTEPAEIAFGCRKIGSEIGSWDRAFIYEKSGGNHMTSVYKNGKDFIGEPEDLQEGVKNYHFFIRRKGWKPMTSEDIVQTCSAVITQETCLEVPKLSLINLILIETVDRITHRIFMDI